MRWKILEVPDITSMPTGRPLPATRTDHLGVSDLGVNRKDRAICAVSGCAKPLRQQLGVETSCHGAHPFRLYAKCRSYAAKHHTMCVGAKIVCRLTVRWPVSDVSGRNLLKVYWSSLPAGGGAVVSGRDAVPVRSGKMFKDECVGGGR